MTRCSLKPSVVFTGLCLRVCACQSSIVLLTFLYFCIYVRLGAQPAESVHAICCLVGLDISTYIIIRHNDSHKMSAIALFLLMLLFRTHLTFQQWLFNFLPFYPLCYIFSAKLLNVVIMFCSHCDKHMLHHL